MAPPVIAQTRACIQTVLFIVTEIMYAPRFINRLVRLSSENLANSSNKSAFFIGVYGAIRLNFKVLLFCHTEKLNNTK